MTDRVFSSRALCSCLLAGALSAAGCGSSDASQGADPPTSTEEGGDGSTTPGELDASPDGAIDGGDASTEGPADGGDDAPSSSCVLDCAQIQTPRCYVAVCNEGQLPGVVGVCVVVPESVGVSCDDGQFCTVEDACDGKGQCAGGKPNDCGMTAAECSAVTCDEAAKTCALAPSGDGDACTPADLCVVDALCDGGECKGKPKDCSPSPLSECNAMACDPATGACEATPDPAKNGASCGLTGDLCMVSRTCHDGQCGGGVPMDCSSVGSSCGSGVCDPANGACVAQSKPEGAACFEGIDPCHVGACDGNGTCQITPATDGTACNDHNLCTAGDVCTAGVCGGAAVSDCESYYTEDFEQCPAGWTFGGDWQCGTPSGPGPGGAHGGTGVVATRLTGNYSNSQAYATTVADSPSISLVNATAPRLAFWAWVHTEGGTSDGFNLKISTNGGANFTQVTSVTPAYSLTIASEPAWGGDPSAHGWSYYEADLSSYAGQDVILRFAFRSDDGTVYPGVYLDDMIVAEPDALPLAIADAKLVDATAEMPYTTTVARTGGSANAVWSITGGTNHAWLTIDPVTGTLSGTPSLANLGPVSLTVKVEEPTRPGNFATKSLGFDVAQAIYSQSFEGACPMGWTLGGDWQCGAPSGVGPATAHGGLQCLATQRAGNYSNNQSYSGTTATSPTIALTGATAPKLTFWAWVDTEGETYDGFNLKVSTDNGMTFTQVTSVTPTYPLTVGGEPAWGGHQAGLGWSRYVADLSSYAGQSVILRFAFRSDSSGTYPGVYLDDVFVTDN